MAPTIEDYVESDLVPQVEGYDEYWRVFGSVPEEGDPEDVLADLQEGVDNCYYEFKGDLDINSPYIGHWRVLIDTLEHLRNIGVPGMLGWKCEHILIGGKGDETVYLGVAIKEKHIKYYIPKYSTEFPWFPRNGEKEWNPEDGFFQKQGECFILPLDISETELGKELLSRYHIIKAVDSALESIGKKIKKKHKK